MLILTTVFWGFMLAQAPAIFVASAEIESTMRQSIANNTLDKRVAMAPGARGTVRVGIVHRTVQEPRALMQPAQPRGAGDVKLRGGHPRRAARWRVARAGIFDNGYVRASEI
jgi:hypothetical protein